MEPGAREPVNEVGLYVADALRSERARTDAALVADCQTAIEGSCIYLPNFISDSGDLSLLEGLKEDLAKHCSPSPDSGGSSGEHADPWADAKAGKDGLVSWSRHLKHEDPAFSDTFRRIVARMEEYFDVDAFATRLNVYRSGSDWKPFHHDSHAYHKGAGDREDFTMGVSLGAARSLQFLHPPSGVLFTFPQRNGDVFAFTSVANQKFQHGVPREPQSGLRMSIIAWGRRRRLLPCNSGIAERRDTPERIAPPASPAPRSGPHRGTVRCWLRSGRLALVARDDGLEVSVHPAEAAQRRRPPPAGTLVEFCIEPEPLSGRPRAVQLSWDEGALRPASQDSAAPSAEAAAKPKRKSRLQGGGVGATQRRR